MSIKLPLKMQHNRVWRIYSGGKLLDEFCGEKNGEDTFFPEDWLASVVTANNPDRPNKPEKEGLSICEDGEPLLDKILKNPEFYLGKEHKEKYGNNLGVLVKFLDSAVRLPIQVHPDKTAAKELFKSDFGKTEAWYILDGREINGEAPYILMGFKDGITEADWRECFETQNIERMEQLLHKFYVKPGDVFLIRGGTPHAIGSGCFLLEIQEPTDYTISVEKKAPDGNPVPDFLCHMGIGFDKMFDCFHYCGGNETEIRNSCQILPTVFDEGENYTRHHVITADVAKAFSMDKTTVTGSYNYPARNSAAILAVTDGEGKIICQNNTISLQKGDTVFLPYNTEDMVIESNPNSSITLLECLPPLA